MIRSFFWCGFFVFSDGMIIEYIHDPLGRRIAKVINGSVTEKYLWQGLTRLLAVYDGSDNLIMRFEYAEGRMPIAMTKNGSTYYLTYDQVGSLRVVADAAGNVVKKVDYDSFGNIINDSNLLFDIPFGFAGGLRDRDTGLVRFGFRDYDPDVGRWTAKDPIGFVGGIDLYKYCLNDPINWTDPEGLVPSTAACGESKEDCMRRCLDQYGPLLAISDALGLWGLGSMATNATMSGVMAAAEKGSLKISNKVLQTSGSKGFAYIKGLPKAFTLRQISSGFALASKISWIPMIAGTSFSATARVYCYISCL